MNTHRFTTTSILAASVLLGGCASLDASRELDAAASASRRVTGSIDPADAWALPVQGESPAWDGTEPLTYDAAVAVALQGDPALRKALSIIVERRAMYVQQGLPPNPTIAFGIGTAVDGMTGAPMLVKGMQMLSWLWKNPHRVAAAEAALRASVYEAADLCVIIMARTRTQVATVLASQRTLTFDEEHLEITDHTVRLVRSLVEQGELAELDLDRAVVEQQVARASVVNARHALEEARLELLATMGRPTASTEWVAVGDLPPNWKIPDEEAALLHLADTGRLDVAAAHESVIAAQADLGLADTKRFPEVAFTLAYQQNFGTREALVPGGSLTLPILDNGGPAIAMQSARLDKAMLDLLAARETAQREVRTSLNRYRDALGQTTIIREGQLAPARAAHRRSDLAYEHGETTLNTVLDTQRDLIRIERSLVAQELKTMQAMCSLRRAVGGSFDAESDAVPELVIQKQPNEEPSS